MMTTRSTVASLSDGALLAHVLALAARERQATADLVASLSELDARQLYLGAGCSSLFTYCTQVLHLSEHAAYGRIAAARCARRFPQILERLADGSLTLTAACLLAPVLTDRNASALLDRVRHKSKREVEHILAEIRPQPAVPTTVRKLPAPRPPRSTDSEPPPEDQPDSIAFALAARPRAAIKPLAPETFKVQFTLSRHGYDHLRRAQDLLRHSIPNGDAGLILERALALLVADLEKKKLAATDRPRPPRAAKKDSRHVPAAVKREVWQRDTGRCAFVGTSGRCTERAFLEIHHVIPFVDGGETTAANLELRCRAHNRHEMDLWSGAAVMRETPPLYANTRELGPDRVRRRSPTPAACRLRAEQCMQAACHRSPPRRRHLIQAVGNRDPIREVKPQRESCSSGQLTASVVGESGAVQVDRLHPSRHSITAVRRR